MLDANGTFVDSKNSESNFTEASYIQLDERIGQLKDVDLNDDDKTDVERGNPAMTDLVDNLVPSTSPLSTQNSKNACFNYTSYRTRKILRIRRKKIKNYLQKIFSSGSIHGKCARLLILITLPMHVLYFYLIQLIENDKIFSSFPFFIVFYLTVAFAQVRLIAVCNLNSSSSL